METYNSMARVEWFRGLLGIWLVNAYDQEVFLFALPFLRMCTLSGQLVYQRNRDTKSTLVRVRGVVGDVAGVVAPWNDGNRVSLYYGPIGDSLDRTTIPPRNAQRIDHYDFGSGELEVHRNYLELVNEQATRFEMALLGAEIAPK